MGFRALRFVWRLVRLTDCKGWLFMPQVNHPCGLTPLIILYHVSKPLELHSGLQPHKVRCLSYAVMQSVPLIQSMIRFTLLSPFPHEWKYLPHVCNVEIVCNGHLFHDLSCKFMPLGFRVSLTHTASGFWVLGMCCRNWIKDETPYIEALKLRFALRIFGIQKMFWDSGGGSCSCGGTVFYLGDRGDCMYCVTSKGLFVVWAQRPLILTGGL